MRRRSSTAVASWLPDRLQDRQAVIGRDRRPARRACRSPARVRCQCRRATPDRPSPSSPPGPTRYAAIHRKVDRRDGRGARSWRSRPSAGTCLALKSRSRAMASGTSGHGPSPCRGDARRTRSARATRLFPARGPAASRRRPRRADGLSGQPFSMWRLRHPLRRDRHAPPSLSCRIVPFCQIWDYAPHTRPHTSAQQRANARGRPRTEYSRLYGLFRECPDRAGRVAGVPERIRTSDLRFRKQKVGRNPREPRNTSRGL